MTHGGGACQYRNRHSEVRRGAEWLRPAVMLNICPAACEHDGQVLRRAGIQGYLCGRFPPRGGGGAGQLCVQVPGREEHGGIALLQPPADRWHRVTLITLLPFPPLNTALLSHGVTLAVLLNRTAVDYTTVVRNDCARSTHEDDEPNYRDLFPGRKMPTESYTAAYLHHLKWVWGERGSRRWGGGGVAGTLKPKNRDRRWSWGKESTDSTT
ncbi:hypothetical protein SKAU_G00025270 [Synaphobranchus kaupii]|uniref:Uncharacterized protein n=1 Tax=Synaphobranchus kaupii TaxID=118154 RepID=A0A9Q1JF38_SYNKA|nr:hypothetical protein SKAU_G00025270 [Synaphobranchus kaupii]